MNAAQMLTVIIPTYNRKKELERSLNYWSELPFNVFVMDGSRFSYTGDIPRNVNYSSLPNLDLKERIFKAASEVTSPYVVMCADDDFLGYNALLKMVEYLECHSEYVSVQGRYIYVTDSVPVRWYVEYSIFDNYHVSSDDVFERAQQALNPCMHQSYSVMRTEAMRVTYDNDITQFNAMEVNAVMMSSILGKHRLLPLFYSVRQLNTNINFDNREGLFNWMDENKELASNWRTGLALSFSKLMGEDIETGLNFFDFAIQEYRKSCEVKKKAIPTYSWKSIVKALLPTVLLKIYRSKFPLGFDIHDDISLMRRYASTVEYPNSQVIAKKDWKRIKDVILASVEE